MDKKTKDCVFSVFLILLGAYVVYEGMAMVALASKPPFNITHFRVSPGMLPVILGAALIFFSGLLLFVTLRGEQRVGTVFFNHLKVSSERFVGALKDIDIQCMIVSVIIMAIYTFFFLGEVPFWAGAIGFLVVLMLYLRATKWYVILFSSCVTIGLVIMLFEKFFKVTLP